MFALTLSQTLYKYAALFGLAAVGEFLVLLQAITMMGQLRQELDGIHGSPFLCGLQRANELEQLPVARLHQLRVQLHRDLNTLDQVSRWSRFLYLKCSGHFCAVLYVFSTSA